MVGLNRTSTSAKSNCVYVTLKTKTVDPFSAV